MPTELEDWRSPLEVGITEDDVGVTEEEEDGKVTEPAEVTDDEPAEAPAEVIVEEEISATGSEDAALVLSSQAVRKQSVKAKKMDPIALEFILDLFLSAPG